MPPARLELAFLPLVPIALAPALLQPFPWAAAPAWCPNFFHLLKWLIQNTPTCARRAPAKRLPDRPHQPPAPCTASSLPLLFMISLNLDYLSLAIVESCLAPGWLSRPSRALVPALPSSLRSLLSESCFFRIYELKIRHFIIILRSITLCAFVEADPNKLAPIAPPLLPFFCFLFLILL